VPWDDAAKRAFVEQQFEAQDTDYRRTRPRATYEVIEVDGQPAGRLYLDRTEGTIHVLDIALLPAFRGGGVGTRLLSDLAAEAEGSGRALEIYVEHMNPARRLYERLGFRAVEEGPVYILMERPPAGRG
jgi:ribosomal protein S18 acetylase RimI-like enzyme